MDSIQITNLKSISDSGPLKIKPITIFVGKNSSGKSTIVRSFPLLKQSGESKTHGTILWTGKYVDFGSYTESLNFKSIEPEIAFHLTLPFNGMIGKPSDTDDLKQLKLTIAVFGDEYTEESYTKFGIEIYGNHINFEYSAQISVRSFSINDMDYTEHFNKNWFVHKSYQIVPLVINRTNKFTPFSKDKKTGEDTAVALGHEIRRSLDKKLSDEKLAVIIDKIKLHDDRTLLEFLGTSQIISPEGSAKVKKWDEKTPAFIKIRDLVILHNVQSLVMNVSEYVHSCFSACKYITPLRAAADRYYRIQNTSIEELDPNGSNLAMYLRAKSVDEIETLNKWLKQEIGFAIEILAIKGHASILITDKNGDKSNIADSGFGYSQMLPILIQIWDLAKEPEYRRKLSYLGAPITIIIEQPELHLHPKMQSNVGLAFCKAIEIARKNDVNLRIIIETHSKDIIDSIGRSVENNIISNNDVSIYLVDKENVPCVRESSFDPGGFLQNWPYGFFEGV